MMEKIYVEIAPRLYKLVQLWYKVPGDGGGHPVLKPLILDEKSGLVPPAQVLSYKNYLPVNTPAIQPPPVTSIRVLTPEQQRRHQAATTPVPPPILRDPEA